MDKYLLKGDVNGIQEFIFSVQSKKAAKSLKSRSYLIEVVCNMAYEYCKKLLNGTYFYNGGGNFFILFDTNEPETKIDEIVSDIQIDIEKSLLRNDYAISLTYVLYDESNFGESWNDLNNMSNYTKLNRYKKSPTFFDPYFRETEEIEVNDLRVSQNIKTEIAKINKDLSNKNALYRAITDEMVKRRVFEYNLFDIKVENNWLDFENRLKNKLPLWKNYNELDSYISFRENIDIELKDKNEIKEYNIIDFEALGDFAEHRTGTNKIGILKLDVDNLGQLFKKQGNVGKLKQLSEKVSVFFDKRLYEIFNMEFSIPQFENDPKEIKEAYNANIYPIFAGGDDCFIIGGWDAILCFTRELHNAFEVEFEDETTISAGIIMIDSSYPVKSFAEKAEEALLKAKKQPNKNSVCFFDLTFSWDEFKTILDVSFSLKKAMEQHKINRSYLDKVRKSAKGFNALQNDDGADFNKIYKLKYYLGRKSDDLKDVTELLFEPYYDNLKERLLKRNTGSINVSIYPAIARVTELLTKTKLDYE